MTRSTRSLAEQLTELLGVVLDHDSPATEADEPTRAARMLGITARELVSSQMDVTELQYWSICRRLSEVATDAAGRHDDLRWGVAPVVGSAPLPRDGTFHAPASSLAPMPLVVMLRQHELLASGPKITLHAHHEYAEELADLVTELRDSVAAVDGPLNGEVLRLFGGYSGGREQLVPRPERSRSSVVAPPGVWEALDRNVSRTFTAAGRLARAGLPMTRGVLLAGEPGVGKSALVEVMVSEVEGVATTLLPDAAAVEHNAGHVYDLARALAPTLVVIEDIDLIGGADRRGSRGSGLRDLLDAMDGPRRLDRPVITLATTNAPLQLDDALRRARRFDEVIEVEPPDLPSRHRLLEVLLRNVDHHVAPDELQSIARQLDGGSGADVEQVVRHAVVLAGEAPVSHTHLARAVGVRPTGTTPAATYL